MNLLSFCLAITFNYVFSIKDCFKINIEPDQIDVLKVFIPFPVSCFFLCEIFFNFFIFKKANVFFHKQNTYYIDYESFKDSNNELSPFIAVIDGRQVTVAFKSNLTNEDRLYVSFKKNFQLCLFFKNKIVFGTKMCTSS